MPLLDGSRTGDAVAVAVTASVHNGIPVIDGIDPTTENGRYNDDPNRRQKIVVVGLGMVAVAFMCVQVCKFAIALLTNYIVRNLSSSTRNDASTTLSLLEKSRTLLTTVWAYLPFSSTARSKICTLILENG
jgi:hypothetical protein